MPSHMKVRRFLLFASAISSAPATGGDFPASALLSIGFAEVRLEDLKGSETYVRRAKEPGGFLQVSEDLNRDGKRDEVRILQNREKQIAYVAAAIMGPRKLDTYVLASLPLADAPYLAIASSERILPDGTKSIGIAIFDLRTGVGESTFYDGEEFSITMPITRSVETPETPQ